MSGLRDFTVHTLITFTVLAGTSAWVAHNRRAAISDFPQDYVSARAWLDGESPYRKLGELYDRYGIVHDPERITPINPHPPVAILLTVPYAFTSYDTGLSWQRWTQIAAITLTWALGFRMFRPPVPGLVWSLAGGAFGLWAPVWEGLAWGQPVGLLALLTIWVWALARAERPLAYGLVLGAATLVRPFVAIQIVLACRWSFRDQLRMGAGLLCGGLVPFAILGIWPWEWYRLASAVGSYVTECGSIPGVLHLGAGGGQVLYAVAAAALALLRWRHLGVDETAALAAVIAMLIYPLAWFQYDTGLVPVVAFVAARSATKGNRLALWLLVLYLLMRAVPDLVPTGGSGIADLMAHNKQWLQVMARSLLLGAVIAVARPLSGNAPSGSVRPPSPS